MAYYAAYYTLCERAFKSWWCRNYFRNLIIFVSKSNEVSWSFWNQIIELLFQAKNKQLFGKGNIDLKTFGKTFSKSFLKFASISSSSFFFHFK